MDVQVASRAAVRMNSDTSHNTEKAEQKVSGAALKRLQKEFKSFVSSPPPGLELDEDTLSGADLGLWRVKMAGPAHTLYDGEQFVVQFKFNGKSAANRSIGSQPVVQSRRRPLLGPSPG